MKIANIDGGIPHIFWTTWVTSGLHPFSRIYIFGKSSGMKGGGGGGSNRSLFSL